VFLKRCPEVIAVQMVCRGQLNGPEREAAVGFATSALDERLHGREVRRYILKAALKSDTVFVYIV
jgi:hypothetical protein